MRSLKSRLRHIEAAKGKLTRSIYIFKIGDGEDCNMSSEAAYHEELKKPKYNDAIVIRDLDNWV